MEGHWSLFLCVPTALGRHTPEILWVWVQPTTIKRILQWSKWLSSELSVNCNIFAGGGLEIFQKLSKYDRDKTWANSVGKISLAWLRVAINLQFVKNVLSVKNNKAKCNQKKRYACTFFDTTINIVWYNCLFFVNYLLLNCELQSCQALCLLHFLSFK